MLVAISYLHYIYIYIYISINYIQVKFKVSNNKIIFFFLKNIKTPKLMCYFIYALE